MTNKTIGKIHEKRGDDTLTVVTTEDGDIVEIGQYDSIGHRYFSINFFAETAPRLVALIQKATGVKAEKVEYEYNIEDTNISDGEKSVRGFWVDDPSKLAVGLKNLRSSQQTYVDYGGHVWHTYRIVRREKPKPYEYVEEQG
jgi:hypothetical protein